jgi:hypothetical protein
VGARDSDGEGKILGMEGFAVNSSGGLPSKDVCFGVKWRLWKSYFSLGIALDECWTAEELLN